MRLDELLLNEVHLYRRSIERRIWLGIASDGV